MPSVELEHEALDRRVLKITEMLRALQRMYCARENVLSTFVFRESCRSAVITQMHNAQSKVLAYIFLSTGFAGHATAK